MTLKTLKDSPITNMLVIFIVTMICVAIALSAPYLDQVVLRGLMNIFYPLAIGGITTFLYLLSRMVTKQYNWIITVIGVVVNLFVSIHLYNNL